MAVGLAIMGITQWVFAVTILTRPSRSVLILGGVLHSAIAALWIVFRTIGLGFVSGAESPAEVGVADLAANIFSVAVVGVTVIGMALHRLAHPVVIPSSVATRIKAVVLADAIFLTVPALLAPHDHAHHDSESHTSETSQSHDHAPNPGTDTPEHDHAGSHTSTP
ncbi:MAG: hypothetical protein ACRDU9_03765 [Acidimicrobiia bacterium]